MKMYVDAAGGINASSEVNAPSEDSSGKENDGKPSSEKGNVDVAAFLTEIKPHHSLSRVGTSQHGPRCHFDGVELKFPISREVWESERRLLKARSDLAHFVAIIDTRLYDMGYARSDAVFWEREARRMTRLFTTGRRNKKGKPAPGRRPSLTPPPKIVISDASTPSPLLPASDPTPQIEPPQHTSEPIQAPTGSSQRTGGSVTHRQ
ncbi:hypothetical protein ASPSYDRAFT_490323 [Aspergillus sydowii CBS 593.65]|uniref:Uncharacterized protein n=1 Tax=Aspergillus sydowii CBS 593.65 TaxID=1036612 RepID=A0A1L9T453_9EURO|nr:uncharacterized protein ASPSYDRAFT_490323 [Aspergillus sydowii CBS 593.65]OJJ54131.1 hypothetical protein ASPSYDRAFT_490323 [Aspergillus sydowii CBS 593.65]